MPITQRLVAQRGRARGDLPALISDLGLEQTVLNLPWGELQVLTHNTCMHTITQEHMHTHLEHIQYPLNVLCISTRAIPALFVCTCLFAIRLCCIPGSHPQDFEARLVHLAIVLCLRPDFVLLDDPTACLDPQLTFRSAIALTCPTDSMHSHTHTQVTHTQAMHAQAVFSFFVHKLYT